MVSSGGGLPRIEILGCRPLSLRDGWQALSAVGRPHRHLQAPPGSAGVPAGILKKWAEGPASWEGRERQKQRRHGLTVSGRLRFQLLGRTLGGRMIKLIFQLKPRKVVRIITGWPL
jgi:hypothetical protein